MSKQRLLRNIVVDSTWKVITRASHILDKNDRRKVWSLVLIHAFLGLLDIVAVVMLGLLGSLSVTGVASSQHGDRVSGFLKFVGLSESSLRTQAAVLGLVAVAILVFRSIVSLILSRKVLFFLSRRSAYITTSLLKKLLSQNVLKINLKNIQELIYALTSGVNAVASGILGAATVLAADIFLIFAFTFSLFFIDPYMATSSLALFSGVAFVLYRVLHGRAQNLGETATQMEIQSNQKIFEVISSFKELLVKNRRDYYASQISSLRLNMSESVAQMAFLNFLSKYIIEISMVIGGLIVAAIQFLVNPASRAVAVIAIFLVSSSRIAPAILRIQSGLVLIRNNVGIAKPTLDLIEEYLHQYLDESHSHTRKSPLPIGNNFIPEIFVNVRSFRYPESSAVNISNVKIKIETGEFIGVIGMSGAGKTTLIDLILGLLDPTEGMVTISGLTPIKAFEKWPGAVAYVPQETKLVGGSIKDNICIGFDSRDFEDTNIEKLLLRVELPELVKTVNGIHTSIGEGGIGLSGGQKQRLGIARALLTNPKLIILDESTSALDSNTETKVLKMLKEEAGLETVIMISHRLSIFKEASRIIYIEKGEVMGIGSVSFMRKKFDNLDYLFRKAGM